MPLDLILRFGPRLGRSPEHQPLDALRGVDEPPRRAGPGRLQGLVQRGIGEIEDALNGAGIDQGRLELAIDAAKDGADVSARLAAGTARIATNAVDTDLHTAVQRVFRELSRRIEQEEPFAGPPPPPSPEVRVPWSTVSDSVHRHALHAVIEQIRLGALPASRVDPRDLADQALTERLAAGPVRDLGPALGELFDRVDALVEESVARCREDAGEWEIETPIDEDELTLALFELDPDDRNLFSRAVVDGLPIDLVAAAQHLPETEVADRLIRSLDRLEDALGVEADRLLEWYARLGRRLRQPG